MMRQRWKASNSPGNMSSSSRDEDQSLLRAPWYRNACLVLLFLCTFSMVSDRIFSLRRSLFETDVVKTKTDDDHGKPVITTQSASITEPTAPRMIQLVLDKNNNIVSTFPVWQNIRLPREGTRSVRKTGSLSRQEKVRENSKDYKELHAYFAEEKQDCQREHAWMKTYRPACNTIHEAALDHLFDSYYYHDEQRHARASFLAHGSYRSVWKVQSETGEFYVFKPMQFYREFTYRNQDRMRRETLILDQLTSAKYILNVYSACGTSTTFELADGTMEQAILSRRTKPLTPRQRLWMATQAAMGLASLHNMDVEGRASIAHTDVSPDQYLHVDGRFKLNDFNRARYLQYSQSTGALCPFYVGGNKGRFRSPEEYAYEGETEKVDVYSLGNIFYMLLQDREPFDTIHSEEAQSKVLEGIRPPLMPRDDGWNSSDPIYAVIQHAMEVCHMQGAQNRPTARQVETMLKRAMNELDPGRLTKWRDE